jgi:hypothetical protein
MGQRNGLFVDSLDVREHSHSVDILGLLFSLLIRLGLPLEVRCVNLAKLVAGFRVVDSRCYDDGSWTLRAHRHIHDQRRG